MTKKLDTASITNELAQTAFFRKSAPPLKQQEPLAPPPSEKAHGQVTKGNATDQHVASLPVPDPVPGGVRVGVPHPVPLIPKVKRIIRQRQPFDIDQDQYDRLKKTAEEEKGYVNGRGMSQMVREAIDNYLRDNTAPKGE